MMGSLPGLQPAKRVGMHSQLHAGSQNFANECILWRAGANPWTRPQGGLGPP